ncbi:cupin domain-containing protein [Chelatococcus reniformis]|uniref:Cupin type-2 domain-containing protein n=1 Tax=Chelatococcus reniformis TaxID=1494448 RepID=A0A916UKM5_9HYPH|nr:cupin domain-containing protein [Chelatococcus reniformis]GGC76447.1 hypothetical protein GCM10010994_38470 [Chelatococcus reniformis]
MPADTTLPPPHDLRLLSLALVAAPGCALAVAKAIPLTMDAASTVLMPLCSTASSPGSSVEVVASYPLADIAGKRVTVVRVVYGPGAFTPPHRHPGTVTAYITKGEIRSQLGGGPLETFTVGQSFFEPPGATHVVSANASTTEPAELIGIFVADEGAQLTTYLD